MMDAKDAELINLLREDSRMPVSAIAKKLRMGRATVKQRMERLEEAHIIRRYTLDIDEGKAGSGYCAIVLIAFMPGFASQREVAKRIASLSGVSELHLISGAWDMVARINAPSMEDIGRVVIDRLRSIEGVGRTETCSVFATIKG